MAGVLFVALMIVLKASILAIGVLSFLNLSIKSLIVLSSGAAADASGNCARIILSIWRSVNVGAGDGVGGFAGFGCGCVAGLLSNQLPIKGSFARQLRIFSQMFAKKPAIVAKNPLPSAAGIATAVDIES